MPKMRRGWSRLSASCSQWHAASRAGGRPNKPRTGFTRAVQDRTMRTDRVPPEPASAGAAGPVLVPGRNCWQIEHADRFGLLVDASNYFSALREALKRARRSIFILGWDIDS